jgi:hypothetical protein
MGADTAYYLYLTVTISLLEVIYSFDVKSQHFLTSLHLISSTLSLEIYALWQLSCGLLEKEI